jgi:hypothetical protein
MHKVIDILNFTSEQLKKSNEKDHNFIFTIGKFFIYIYYK